MTALGGNVDRVATAQFGPIFGCPDLGDAGVLAQLQPTGSGTLETEIVLNEFDADRSPVGPLRRR